MHVQKMKTIYIYFFFLKLMNTNVWIPQNFIIPLATSCGGYNVFYPFVSQSVSQSVSSVFLVSATPLKPLNRISWNFVVIKVCISTGNFNSIFFLGIMPFLNIKIWHKWKILLKTVFQRNSSKTALQNFVKLCSYEGHTVLTCISTENSDSIFLNT